MTRRTTVAAAPAVLGGFTRDDSTVDEAAATVTCPNMLTARITRTRKRSSVRAVAAAR